MNTAILKSCCRVCLVAEPIMIYVYDKVDEFDMTLSELLETCGSLRIDLSDDFSKLICKDCTEELLMVAKFREKCKSSEETLSQLADSLQTTAAAIETDDPYSQEAVDESVEQFDDVDDSKTDMDMFEYTEVESPEHEHTDEKASLNGLLLDDIDTGNNATDEMGDLNELTVILENPEQVEQEELYTHLIEETDALEVALLDVQEEQTRTSDTNETADALPDLYPVRFGVGNVTVNYSCDYCGAGFMHLNNLNKHLLTHPDAANHLFECNVCTMVFTCSVRYYKHIKSHKDDAADELPEITTDKRLGRKATGAGHPKMTTTLKKSARREHNCPHCERCFVSKSMLDTHIRTHTGERPFACPECNKTFTTRGGLDLHTRRHLGVKPYQCEICDKRFVETSNLRVHMRIHTGEKPHKCNRCSRSFSRVFLLQIHQRTHTGERPYTCTHCDKAFAQQGDLAAHRRTHTGERPHQCEVCGKGFIKSSALTGHMRRHDKLLGNAEYTVDSDEHEAWAQSPATAECDEMIVEYQMAD